jgi:transposase
MNEGSWVGLDVHARSVVAGVLDAGTGEVRTVRVPPGHEGTVEWLKSLPAPVRVAYEAGPTGYRLVRACDEAGIACIVAAPSRIRPAAAERVKTDRRDAERLARLLRMGELVAVRVPEPHEEAARDLVRAREDARGDLMRARHRRSPSSPRTLPFADTVGRLVCLRGVSTLTAFALTVELGDWTRFAPSRSGRSSD